MFLALTEYALRITPGLALLAAAFTLTRPLREPLLRIGLLIIGFILIRDAMTPAGLWSLGADDGSLWLRFTDDAATLLALAAASLALTFAVLRSDARLRSLVRWGPANHKTIAAGIAGGILAAAPIATISTWSTAGPADDPAPPTLLPILLVFALSGNLAEEVLFRGLLQGRLEPDLGKFRAALASAVSFAACHALLASVVTDVGWPLLLFTLYEGLICAYLRMRYGVLPAALAHGIAIFLLSSALF